MTRWRTRWLGVVRFLLRAGHVLRHPLVALALACALAGPSGCKDRPAVADAGSSLPVGGCRSDGECKEGEHCSPVASIPVDAYGDEFPHRWIRQCRRPSDPRLSPVQNALREYGRYFDYSGTMYGTRPPVIEWPSVVWSSPRLIEGLGRLDADAFHAAYSAWHGEVEACYLKELLVGWEGSGIVEVRFEIHDDGQVATKITHADPSVDDDVLHHCIGHAARRSGAERFLMARPPVGGTASVLVTFEFRRGTVGRWLTERPSWAGWKGEHDTRTDPHPWATNIAGEGYRGVLFQDASWIATEEDVARAERLIAAQLPALRPTPASRATDLPSIVADLSSFGRQYVPLPAREGNQRLLGVTFLLDPDRMHPEWEANRVSTCNEWPEDFRLQVALDAERVEELEMHARRWRP
ncbi:MAG: hypothetical protein HY907_23045 [Deltaproteobacteria bacterium]|nr:hypothetical protein [Deltaproteobacteria bacterium]